VTSWITHNEPYVAAFVGHLWGEHAPGIRDRRTAVQVSHHLLLSHGLAVQAVRSVRPNSRVGITLDLSPMQPAGDSREDEESAQLADGFKNRWFLDPVFRGRYPDDALEALGSDAPEMQDGDLAVIAAPLDFLGVNYYTRSLVRRDPGKTPPSFSSVRRDNVEYTEMEWEVYPDGLREILERLHRDYPAPAYYVTENGASFPDSLGPDSRVNDTRRRDYLESHFNAAAQAIAAGVPLKGYFVWTLMDNFEWAHGFSKRFGLFYVDYATQQRIWKDSARWYREWIGEQAGVGAV
jgi:beta-glucosidase